MINDHNMTSNFMVQFLALLFHTWQIYDLKCMLP